VTKNCLKIFFKTSTSALFERIKMKKLLITFIIVLFSSSAFAGSCNMLIGKIDEKIQKAQELRDAGQKAHEEGDHAKSEELLIKALNILKS